MWMEDGRMLVGEGVGRWGPNDFSIKLNIRNTVSDISRLCHGITLSCFQKSSRPYLNIQE